MSITDYQITRLHNTTQVTVTSDLSGTIYYHWYLDGVLVASTQSNVYTIFLPNSDQIRVEVIDTNDADYDPVANAPAGWSARRTLYWHRSLASDIDHYRVEQSKDEGAWTTVATVAHEDRRWYYSALSGRLDDLSDYVWRVVPVDQAGNDGTPIALDSERVVRTPDAIDFTVSFSKATTKVTFSEAS